MKRIIITGSSGSGKTTLGHTLSSQLKIPVTDLDDLYWLPNWTPRPRHEFEALITQTAGHPTWIICGNQSRARHLFWPKADTVIWLDLPLHTLFFRVLKRGLIQFKTQEPICNGNHQTLKQFLWLLFYWVLCSYRRRRRTNIALREQTPHLRWIHLKSLQEVQSFLLQQDHT